MGATTQDGAGTDPARRARRRAWALGLVSVALLVSLSALFYKMMTARPATVDALVLYTVPSGAEVTWDGKPLGKSPLKLERIGLGTHVVRAEKVGFVPVEQEVVVEEDLDDPIEIALRPVPLPGSAAATPAEQIAEYADLAEKAFAKGELVRPPSRNALYYADAIGAIDRTNEFQKKMRDRIRTALLADARRASSRKDYLRAKAAFEELLSNFPGDVEAAAGLAEAEERLRRDRRDRTAPRNRDSR
jgi:hypothetical protein